MMPELAAAQRLRLPYSPGSRTTAVPLALTMSIPPPEPTWIVS
jgi:hypothetical protein